MNLPIQKAHIKFRPALIAIAVLAPLIIDLLLDWFFNLGKPMKLRQVPLLPGLPYTYGVLTSALISIYLIWTARISLGFAIVCVTLTLSVLAFFGFQWAVVQGCYYSPECL